MTRRDWIPAVAGMTTLLATTFGGAVAHAQAYPSKPIRFIVPFTPGGGADTTSRMVAPKLGERLGQQVVVENRGGAGGTIGGSIGAKAPPDGYTIVLGTANMAAGVSLFAKRTFDPLKDFAPVSLLAKTPSILAVHPSLPVKSVKELIALARAHPGQISYAGGVGSLLHLDAEYFKTMAKVDLLQVPYNGSGPSMIGVLSGEASVVISPTLLVLPHAKSGRLRALAITSAQRFAGLPEMPTVAESGLPGFEAHQWYGILVPTGTPEGIIARLNSELVQVVNAPDLKSRLLSDASIPIGSTPAEFGAYLAQEIAKWAKVVKYSGAKQF
ncbi:MAG TPA: tripartite tricarboxylate transporter substrate binding protein [Burkholderiales bacterium]|nr:tripartite tricarboxylate transporter substrate binding protein [Burkholderiales bacterium]